MNQKIKLKRCELRTRLNHLDLELRELHNQLRNGTDKEDWAERYSKIQDKNDEIRGVIIQLRELET